MTREQRWAVERIGHLLYTRERYDEATALFEGLTRMAPQAHYAWYALGLVARARGDVGLAADYLTHAVQLAPNDPATRLAALEVAISQGDKEGAARLVQGLEELPDTLERKRALVLKSRWFG